MKEMRIRKKLVIGMIMLAIACFGIGVMMTTSFSVKAETQGLTGFTSPGASVFIATDDTDTKQMRFQVNLDTSADKKYQDMAANQSLQSGVVVLPYDIYQAEGYTELTKDTEKAVTADVTKNWTANENGYESYAYLPADLIPQDQYNRTLIARGYIVDGENVYYTEPVRASMAYVAWQNLGMEGGAYNTILRSYMGPYTLTYGAGKNEKIENLYYGDALSLPTNINGYDVEGWFWDEDCTNAIASTDYATGSMSVYYKFREFTVSGTVSCADSVDLTTVRILVDGVEKDVAVDASGAYSVSVESGTHDFAFACAGYKAYALNTTVSGNSTLNAELKSDFYEIGNFGNVASTPNLVPEDDFDGQYTVEGKDYLLIMPNTATSDPFTYAVAVSNITRTEAKTEIGICLTDGKYKLTASYRAKTDAAPTAFSLCITTEAGQSDHAVYLTEDDFGEEVTLKFVVTKESIQFYCGENKLIFSFMKDSCVSNIGNPGWTSNNLITNTNGVTDAYKTRISGFFAENASIAVGINSGLNTGSATATYRCSIEKHVAVSGRISAGDSVDLTQTALTVDGIATAITVNSDGTYTAYVPKGTHTFTFENGAWSATQEVTVESGANAVDVTLIDGTVYEYTVSGTVSCADSVDLTTVGILVDGVETDATVDASGAYSLIVEEGTHDFTFFCAGYKAYALNTTVSGNSTLNAELKSDFYEIGNFGNVASTPNLVPEDDFDGQYTVEGKDYLLIMPNTATTDGFTYTVTATGSTLRERGDKAYAASVSNGTYVLSVGVYEWETLVVNLNTQGGAGYVSYYDLSGIQRYGANVTIEMVRTASDIKVYIGGAVANSGALYFTFTSTGITLADGVTNKNWVNTFETEGQSKLAGFFGESVSLACGVANLNGAFEATYTCAVVNRAVDGTWRVGNFGTVQSNTPAFNENGEYTISGANQLVLFPNTATSTPFTYTVAVSNVTRTEAKTEIGISLTDGNYKLTVGYRAKTDTAPTAFSLGITTEAGQSDHAVYLTEDDFGEEVTLKFVVTKESIQFYCGENKLIFSFMKDSCVSNIGNPGWTSNNLITNTNGVTDAYKTRISGFFAENAKIAVGINSGLSTGSATATYQCSITKN